MFAALTEEELTTLYRTVKSGRDHTYLKNLASQTDYRLIIQEASAVMRDLHEVNQRR